MFFSQIMWWTHVPQFIQMFFAQMNQCKNSNNMDKHAQMKSNYDFLTFFVIGIHQGHNTSKT